MITSKVREYYDEYLNGILYIFIKTYGEVKWLKAQDLVLHESRKGIPWSKKETDPFIMKYQDDISGLGHDIEKRGTYFPVFITKNNVVMMGVHRVESLKRIQSDKELMCLVMPEQMFNKKRTDKPKYEWRNPKELPHKFMIKVPRAFSIPEDAKYDEYVIWRLNQRVISKSTNEYAELYMENYRDLIDGLKMIPHWIKDYIFKHDIEPSTYLNDKEAFAKWMNT